MTNTASEKQVAFINSLKAKVDQDSPATAQALDISRQLWTMGKFDKKAASALIDALKAAPKVSQFDPRSTPPAEVPEGMHRVDGVIFKVQRAVNGSGHRYAKRLTADQKCYCSDLQGVPCQVCRDPKSVTWKFKYAAGAIRFLSEDTLMTLEEAKAFGALYGSCCRCGATLTDENSIEAGIGPYCAKAFA